MSNRRRVWSALVLLVGLGSVTSLWGQRSHALSSESERSRELTAESRATVLVELFTSEGCSSCPPADELLFELGSSGFVDGVDVVPLSFHVDYWNRLGWKDPFSSSQYTARQRNYSKTLTEGAGVYTPQLVVDGRVGMVGSDSGRASWAIGSAASRAKIPVTLRRRDDDAKPSEAANEVALHVQAGAGVGELGATNLFVALTEDGLTTDVARGENAGKQLRHAAVVRWLSSPIGCALSSSVGCAHSVLVPIAPELNRQNLTVVAWLQERSRGAVIGATRLALE